MTSTRRKRVGVVYEHAQPLRVYEYLWSSKCSYSKDSSKQTFSFVLTDTVIFTQQKPVKWLFTSKQEPGKILCKTKRFLSTACVLQAFLIPRWASTALSPHEHERQILATFTYLDRLSVSGEIHMAVEHLDNAALVSLLEERSLPGLCVLQRFIPTKSGYNHTIRSDYSTERCTMQKCMSPFVLTDTKASLTQRTATFEVKHPLLRHRDVVDKKVLRILAQSNSEMSSHLQSIVGKEVTGLVNYFKIGADSRLYLLWSSMLSFKTETDGAMKEYQLALGHHPAYSSDGDEDYERSPTLHKSLIGCSAQLKVCPNCSCMLPRDEVQYEVTYKSIIRQMERGLVDNSNKVARKKIFSLLRGISGTDQVERLRILKQSATYLYQTVQLCFTCARYFNLDSMMSTRCFSDKVIRDEVMANRPEVTLFKPAEEKEATIAREPVMVMRTRANSAGSTRLNAYKKYDRMRSNVSRQHLLQLSPRSNAFEPLEPLLQEQVRQLALHLKHKYGHPSLRFALSQSNVFPVGPVIPLHTLRTVCRTEGLQPRAQHWTELCQVHGSSVGPQTVDIDAIDTLLTAGSKSLHQTTRPLYDPLVHSRGQETLQSSSSIRVPKRPPRPRSCIPCSTRSRQLSLSTSKKGQD